MELTPVLPLTSGRFAVKSGGMEYKKLFILPDKYRPGALAQVGVFFIIRKSPRGSIFLLAGSA
jgi:hypothetical protein